MKKEATMRVGWTGVFLLVKSKFTHSSINPGRMELFLLPEVES
ncbi:MAG: hypothetical protein Q8R84_12790 [Candidatus Nitrotoga sp.]|nr:hypothetical protein [Candidatus Nitrotoga sp.]